MKNQKVIFLRGLPASGKSTFAKEYVKNNPRSIRINKDSIREMLHGGVWSKANEKFILEVRDTMIKNALRDGLDVVVDDTNFSHIHERTVLEIIHSHVNSGISEMDNVVKRGIEFEVKFFDTPLEECIRRDKNRTIGHVGKKVITDMWNKYVRKDVELIPYIHGLEEIIICDIDGTIAKCGDRDIYDGSKVHLDTVIEHVADIIKLYFDEGKRIVFLSGRSDEHKDVTRKWLDDNGLFGGELLMRKQGDSRDDAIVKEEIYREHIEGKFNVKLVIDDRLKVCRMWHRLGLPLLRVGIPDADDF